MNNHRLPVVAVAAFALLVLALGSVTAQSPEIVRGRVVAITDGDTLTVLDANKKQHKIRLQGIDAPERAQAYGTRARQELSDLAFEKDVEVRVDKRDRYGRSVSTVMVGGRDINLEMVRAGLAWHYKLYANEQSAADRSLYAKAEEEARAAKRGLWVDANPTPPWEFRRGGRAPNNNGGGDASSQPRATVRPDETLYPPANSAKESIAIIGNRRSRIYHLPNCPNYQDVSERNRVLFSSKEEAERAGYRMAKNCSP
jgi:endonuclease YncB( thermonuclease family)